MKKSLKKASAIVLTMALMIVLNTPVFAGIFVGGSYTGQISADDLIIKLDLPTNLITVKPYLEKQIQTTPQYFYNYNEISNEDGKISYMVGMAGYTCLASSGIKVYPTIPEDDSKVFTAVMQLGKKQPSEITDVGAFANAFVTDNSLVITELSNASYNGTSVTSYSENPDISKVKVEPGDYVPYRVTGSVNEAATWKTGDSIVIIPVFSVEVVIE